MKVSIRSSGSSSGQQVSSPPSTRKKKIGGVFYLLVGVVVLGIVGTLYLRDNNLPKPDIKSYVEHLVHSWSRGDEVKRTLCVQDELPYALKDILQDWYSDQNEESADDYIWKSFGKDIPEDCDLAVATDRSDVPDKEDYDLAWREYFVIVARYSTSLEDLSIEEFSSLLSGSPAVIDGSEYELVLDSSVTDFVNRRFSVGVGVESVDDATGYLLQNTKTIAVIPFDKLSPRLRALSYDSVSLLSAEDTSGYGLVDEVWVKDRENIGIYSRVVESFPEVNFREENLVTIVTTGTSVYGARGEFQKIVETGDSLYPIREVAGILRDADIAHVSNEASFVDGCEQYSWTMSFCAPTESLEGFTYAGIDVVGLTGNHILDYGEDAFINTLDMYDGSGIKYFGGGRNLQAAHTPAIFDVGGMKFAFLGYNYIPPASYFAAEESPGSAQLDEALMKSDIAAADQVADFVIVDMQWGQEYEHVPDSWQIQFGQEAVEAGADIVNGVHPHWVQEMDFAGDSVIFYGLGNFLFDQLWSLETTEGVMIRHYFYGGKYVGFEPIPTILSDGGQPRVVTGEDRVRIFGYLFPE